MKKHLLLLSIFSLCFFLPGWSLPRTKQEVHAIVTQYFQGKTTTRTVAALTEIPSSALLPNTRTVSNEAFYVFTAENAGFLIVSGDDRMQPVLGYSDTGTFVTENLPDNLRGWLLFYAEEFESLATCDEQNTLLVAETRAEDNFPATVAPLLGDIAWDQTAPYNNACPTHNGERLVTGCVATAMAQIMMYHKWPEKGKGVKNYTYTIAGTSYEITKAFSATTFQWDKMLPTYTSTYTPESAEYVAELMYSCGVAVKMGYNTAASGGSGAYDSDVPPALINHFKYDENIQKYSRTYYKNAEWIALAKTELAENRPIYYNGRSPSVGHAFVVDGYDANNFFHLNWGWGGYNNGYFLLTALNPDGQGTGGGSGGGYNMSQGMIIGIQKPNANSKYVSHLGIQEPYSVNVTSIARNGTFNLTIQGVFNLGAYFSGTTALALYKDGKLHTNLGEITRNNYETYTGFEGTASNLSIPTTVEEGTYQLLIMSKDARETEWQQVRAPYGVANYISVFVNASTINFSNPDVSAKLSCLSFEKTSANLYLNRTGNFKLKVKNDGEECMPMIGVLLTGASSSALISSEIAFLEPGEEKELNFSGTIAATGLVAGNTYTILPALQTATGTWTTLSSGFTFTLQATPTGTPVLTLTKNISFNSTPIKMGEDFQVNLSINNSGALYDGTIAVPVFPYAGGYSLSMRTSPLFIESGETKEITLTLPALATADNYFLQVRYSLNGDWGNFIPYDTNKSFAFTVSDLTGIALNQQEETFKLYLTGNDLQVKAGDEAILQLDIITLSGTVVKQSVDRIEIGATHTISVAEFPAGLYVVRLHTESGVNTTKFMKK
ncbi:T9SS C-terminal target domain-containing protein [Bacteroides sp. 214]|uniref:thiol protease/hemagglutinin PrtT n=1 Tax=Bacteroides sp. 214 TaxID=2302935 RepID=UPI0013D22220|nr:thiol protease/hemagglutinin PrtT [Bacteroides sp. 214]NDW11610.1 T9SS C-terminal target domain-containing protein [Bacteroides sp. 214]